MDFDRQPTLIGESILLRPLDNSAWDNVSKAASDPSIWELHPASDRHVEATFRSYFEERLASRGSLVVVERSSDRVLGWSSYGRHVEGFRRGGDRVDVPDSCPVGWCDKPANQGVDVAARIRDRRYGVVQDRY